MQKSFVEEMTYIIVPLKKNLNLEKKLEEKKNFTKTNQ